MVVISNEAAVG